MFIILAKLRASLHQLILKTLRAWQHFKLVRTCNECVEYNTRIRPQWILNSQLILGPQWNMFIIGSSCCVRRLYGTHVGGVLTHAFWAGVGRSQSKSEMVQEQLSQRADRWVRQVYAGRETYSLISVSGQTCCQYESSMQKLRALIEGGTRRRHGRDS